jgi:hypothetical protein
MGSPPAPSDDPVSPGVQRDIAKDGPSHSSRKRIAIAGATLAVAVVIVLLVAGWVPGVNRFPPGRVVGPVTEGEAAQVAQTLAHGVPGGPWSLVNAIGWSYTYGFQANDSGFTPSNCLLQGGAFRNLSYGPYSGNYWTGDAVLWLLWYNATGPTDGELLVAVENGTAIEVGAAYGPNCRAVGPASGTLVDTSVAVRAVLGTPNGSRFAASFATANVTLWLLGSPLPPYWLVDFGACDGFNPHEGTIIATVWAENGTIDQPPSSWGAC